MIYIILIRDFDHKVRYNLHGIDSIFTILVFLSHRKNANLNVPFVCVITKLNIVTSHCECQNTCLYRKCFFSSHSENNLNFSNIVKMPTMTTKINFCLSLELFLTSHTQPSALLAFTQVPTNNFMPSIHQESRKSTLTTIKGPMIGRCFDHFNHQRLLPLVKLLVHRN